MPNRKLELSKRKENIREVKAQLERPVQFGMEEIKKHFCDSMKSIREQFSVADDLLKIETIDGAKNIYRSQIVFLEGILDFYMHEMVKYGLYKIFVGDWKHTEKYKKMNIPMSEVEKIIAKPENKSYFFDFINKNIARTVMQDWECIRDYLNTIGVEWNEVCQQLHQDKQEQEAIKEEKSILKELYKRRNEIAHQNDRSHFTAEKNDIDKKYVKKFIDHIENFVNVVHDIASEKG